MTLIAVAGAKGAPGVTTLTVALAALTPNAIAADLDPDGGDLALRYRREDGAPLDQSHGLLSLAASLRRGPGEFAGPGPLDAHLQVTNGGLDVLLGVEGPDQALGLGPLWAPLARTLAESPRTVFADCGRVGPSSPVMPVLLVADAVIMVVRPELEELSHLRERLRFLLAALPSRYSGRARVGVVLLAADRDRAAAGRTEQLLRSSGIPVPVLGRVADDPKGAARLRGVAHGGSGRTTLIRSVRSLLPAVRALAGDVPEVTRYRQEAAPPAPPPAPTPPPAAAPPPSAAAPLPAPPLPVRSRPVEPPLDDAAAPSLGLPEPTSQSGAGLEAQPGFGPERPPYPGSPLQHPYQPAALADLTPPGGE